MRTKRTKSDTPEFDRFATARFSILAKKNPTLRKKLIDRRVYLHEYGFGTIVSISLEGDISVEFLPDVAGPRGLPTIIPEEKFIAKESYVKLPWLFARELEAMLSPFPKGGRSSISTSNTQITTIATGKSSQMKDPQPKAISKAWVKCPYCRGIIKMKKIEEHIRTIHPGEPVPERSTVGFNPTIQRKEKKKTGRPNPNAEQILPGTGSVIHTPRKGRRYTRKW